MRPDKKEESARRLHERYQDRAAALWARIASSVVGMEFAVNGYTTAAQAGDLAHHLALRPGMRLLDLGCGQGWPGIFLVTQSGCGGVLTDIPRGAVDAARRRAADEGFGGRVACVRASAPSPPFRARSFDAVVHTDVLC
jgi:methylase of polypeptide subunit release factors